MSFATKEHFRRAIADVAAYGDNDVLPFDVDTKFISECSEELTETVHRFALKLETKSDGDCKSVLKGITVFAERLLSPSGPSGFRITTKIHPFWNIYLNGLAVAIAEQHEDIRSPRAHSYRYAQEGRSLFRKEASWRAFKEATLEESDSDDSDQVVVLTDVSSYYEHIYHHRLENFLRDLLPQTNHSIQIDILLSKLAGGRSFGLPVGGQCSRVLAEVVMGSIDRSLEAKGVRWRRYVDDFVLVAQSRSDAYKALGILANALGDLGLSLNRTKTTFLSARHYHEYVNTQLGSPDDESRELREIDLYFDPYSDTPDEDYENLKDAVSQVDVARLLGLELEKGQPDGFVVRQVSRSLRVMDPDRAYGIAATLLDGRNLHSFRANWATVMRGVAFIRGNSEHQEMHDRLDSLIDAVTAHSSHLVLVETNALHYLRTIRFKRNNKRAKFVARLFKETQSTTIRRACIDCWRHWRDREMFLDMRNRWSSLGAGEQRMLWLAASAFGDDGLAFQNQERASLKELWRLGIEKRSANSFAQIYVDWAEHAAE
ncbi:MAG: RNA-directed DNA polymerase [Pseudomonadota bacterium]